MNRTEEPATEIQIHALKHFGCVPDRPLTRSEASELLTQYQHAVPTESPAAIAEKTAHEPFHLRKVVEQAKRTGGADLQNAMLQRQEFWADTCRDMTKMHLGWPEVILLYRQHGCRFSWPTHEQVQEILDALDLALPTWDRDNPELFYQTLELNFPQLLSVR